MPTKRQLRFLSAVAKAARAAPMPRLRGRPVPENLTDEGRQAGLVAMWSAPRCQGKRRDGQPCQKAALRGATRCPTHGGRVEVPEHPANVRRFLTGEMHMSLRKQDEYLDGKAAWDRMPRRDQRDLLDALSPSVAKDSRKLYAAAKVWSLSDSLPPAEWHRRWLAVSQGNQ
jgi:hypothetical protein